MKRFSIGLVAVLMALGFAAFTSPQKSTLHKKAYANWYRYTQPTAVGIADPGNYVFTTSLSGCGEDNNLVCIIETTGSTSMGGHPDFLSGTDVYNDENIEVLEEKTAQP